MKETKSMVSLGTQVVQGFQSEFIWHPNSTLLPTKPALSISRIQSADNSLAIKSTLSAETSLAQW